MRNPRWEASTQPPGEMRTTPRLRLTPAGGDYDLLRPVIAGRVEAAGFALDVVVMPSHGRHLAMLREEPFDVGEPSLGSCLVAHDRGRALTAVPVSRTAAAVTATWPSVRSGHRGTGRSGRQARRADREELRGQEREKKHWLDRADEAAGQHGAQGRDKAREQQER